jgi:hypothetical protein
VSHQFQDQSVPGFDCSENDRINGFFSAISQVVLIRSRYILRIMGESHGLDDSGSMLLRIKLKKDDNWAYLARLVYGLLPWVILFRWDKTSSEVIWFISRSPNSWLNRPIRTLYRSAVFFFGMGLAVTNPD